MLGYILLIFSFFQKNGAYTHPYDPESLLIADSGLVFQPIALSNQRWDPEERTMIISVSRPQETIQKSCGNKSYAQEYFQFFFGYFEIFLVPKFFVPNYFV